MRTSCRCGFHEDLRNIDAFSDEREMVLWWVREAEGRGGRERGGQEESRERLRHGRDQNDRGKEAAGRPGQPGQRERGSAGRSHRLSRRPAPTQSLPEPAAGEPTQPGLPPTTRPERERERDSATRERTNKAGHHSPGRTSSPE